MCSAASREGALQSLFLQATVRIYSSASNYLQPEGDPFPDKRDWLSMSINGRLGSFWEVLGDHSIGAVGVQAVVCRTGPCFVQFTGAVQLPPLQHKTSQTNSSCEGCKVFEDGGFRLSWALHSLREYRKLRKVGTCM